VRDFPLTLLTAVSVQILCQIFKVVLYSIRDGKLSLKYLSTAGGFPSAHSAFVTSLSVSIGLRLGFASDLFAVAFVVSAIVIYDAYRLRGAVQKHAKLLNRMVRRHHTDERPDLNEMIGHSLPEIFSGIAAGGLFAWGVNAVFRAAGIV